MNWLKGKLIQWLIPDYDKLGIFMEEITKAKQESVKVANSITFKEPVIFIGSLYDCKIEMKPIIKPEITLAKVDISAALMASGNGQAVSNCYFHQEPVAIKYKKERDK